MDFNDPLLATKVSYLQARDPSILSWNKPGIENVRSNLEEVKFNDLSDENSTDVNDKCVKVYLRIKKGTVFDHLYNVKDNTLTCKQQTAKGDLINKTYIFTNIFGPDIRQVDIFNYVVKSKVLGFINGSSGTVFTYGASGSGKTFTMIGTADEPGIIPRSLEYLFRTLPNIYQDPRVKPLPSGSVTELNASQCEIEKENTRNLLRMCGQQYEKYSKTYNAMQSRLSDCPAATAIGRPDYLDVWVSFAEIYNEQIYDLLQPQPMRGHSKPKLRLGGLHEQTYIKDLQYYHVRTGLEAYQLLQYGLHYVNYAETNMNRHSSRSHTIFTIRLVQGMGGDKIVSSLNFCDLAGSEKMKKTLNRGERLKESNNINTSLLVFGRCLSQIRSIQNQKDSSSIPPFRESKLTQLFQKALMGKDDTVMIVNINPAENMVDDTQHVLNFSAVAKDIVRVEQLPIVIKGRSSFVDSTGDHLNDSGTDEMNWLREQVAQLTLQLSEAQQEMEDAVFREREHLTKAYTTITEIKEKRCERLSNKCEQLKQKCEQLEQLLQEQQNTITIDDSDEEDDYLQRENEELAVQLKDKEMEILTLQGENRLLRADNERLKGENKELRQNLDATRKDYEDLQKKYESLDNSVLLLEEDLEFKDDIISQLLANEQDGNSINSEDATN